MLVLSRLLLLVGVTLGQQELGSYNVDLSQWSVSGISSGACMATQMHVAYSGEIMGVGMVAGVTYYAAEGSATRANLVMADANNVDVGTLVSDTEGFAGNGDVDPVSNMNSDRVYIFAGTVDTVVDPGNGPKIQQYYNNFFTSTQVEYDIVAEHGFPTDFYGGPCDQLDPEYIINCNYNGAFAILNQMYGGLTQPSGSTPLTGSFYTFNQRTFFTTTTPGFWSMDDIGYAYVPSACLSMELCKLHVAFHGCSQGSYTLGDTFARNTGYNEVGELNNIIIVYPQAVTSLGNPYGCWDWWGYNTYVPQSLYASKDSGQALSVYRMMRQASSQPWS